MPILATDAQLDSIRRHAYDTHVRAIWERGVLLTHEMADRLGEEAIDWLVRRCDLTVTTDDRYITLDREVAS
jgi:hypothetical protein